MYKPQRDVALNRLRHSHLAALIDAREPSIPTTTPRAHRFTRFGYLLYGIPSENSNDAVHQFNSEWYDES
jgi:hypothetical protein